MKKIQALNDHIIVELEIESERKTDSGIVLPGMVVTEPQKYGKVISVGKDIKDIKIGDTVAFAKFGGQDIILNKVVIKVLKKPEIYGIITEE
jgi:chaperonin GroES